MPERRPPAFRPAKIVEVLERHGVEYVLIGGFAAVAHGAPHVTTDVDITPRDELDNLDRLSSALTELRARVRADHEGAETSEFSHDAASLRHERILNLTTTAGNLDISMQPSGTQGYDDLQRDAVAVDVDGVTMLVASLADVIRSKEAADRQKDRAVLPILRRLLDEERRQAD